MMLVIIQVSLTRSNKHLANMNLKWRILTKSLRYFYFVKLLGSDMLQISNFFNLAIPLCSLTFCLILLHSSRSLTFLFKAHFLTRLAILGDSLGLFNFQTWNSRWKFDRFGTIYDPGCYGRGWGGGRGLFFSLAWDPPRTWVPRWGLERDHASAIWMHSVNKEEKLATLYKPIRPSLKLVITPHEPREISSSFPNITSINANSTEPTASRKFTVTFQLGNLHRKSIFEGSEGIGNCNLIQSVRDEHFTIFFF